MQQRVFAMWMLINAVLANALDAHPYILLNLVLACLTVLQAPLIMMSQNRQGIAIGKTLSTITKSARRPRHRSSGFL